jgi:hypothetical protein
VIAVSEDESDIDDFDVPVTVIPPLLELEPEIELNTEAPTLN